MISRHALYTVAILVTVILLVHIIPSAEAGGSEARKQMKAQSEAIKKGGKANAPVGGTTPGDTSKGVKPEFGCYRGSSDPACSCVGNGNCPPTTPPPGNKSKCNSNW